jgi:kinesin family protein 5
MRETMAALDNVDGRPTMTAEEVASLRQELSEKVAQIEKDALVIVNLHRENNLIIKKRDEIETRLTALELEYEELLGTYNVIL